MLAQACTCNQTHVQMKHSLAHLQDLIPTLAGVVAYMFIPAKVGINLVDVLENASFVHVFGCMCMLELTITGWWIIVA